MQARLREIEREADSAEEAESLKSWLKAKSDEDKLKKALSEADSSLDTKAYSKYPTLAEDEVIALVVDDKWMAAIDARIHGEMNRVSQRLTTRVRELAERYDTPLPRVAEAASSLESKVNGHLERMGFSWK